MRRGAILFCVGVVLVATAWTNRQGRPAGRATIIFTCQPEGGATAQVVPWRVRWSDSKRSSGQIAFRLVPSGSISQVTLTPNAAKPWPFPVASIVVSDAQDGYARNPSQDLAKFPAGTYKYNLTGICPQPDGSADTVVIDPDMIIPGL